MKLFLLSLLLLFALGQIFAQPKIFINENNQLNLDTIYPIHFQKVFKIYNNGDQELKIKSTAVSCGCTSIKLDKEVISKRDSAEFPVSIDLTRSEGKHTYHIYLESNDPITPKLDFLINVNVYRDLISIPKKLPTYNSLSAGDSISCKLKLRNLGNENIIIDYPVSTDTKKFIVIGFIQSDNEILGKSEKVFVIKIKILTSEQIISKLIIPTSSKSVPQLEYNFMTNFNK